MYHWVGNLGYVGTAQAAFRHVLHVIETHVHVYVHVHVCIQSSGPVLVCHGLFSLYSHDCDMIIIGLSRTCARAHARTHTHSFISWFLHCLFLHDVHSLVCLLFTTSAFSVHVCITCMYIITVERKTFEGLNFCDLQNLALSGKIRGY